MKRKLIAVTLAVFAAFLIFSTFSFSFQRNSEWNADNRTDFKFINRTEFYPVALTLELPGNVLAKFSVYVSISTGEVDEFTMDGVEWSFRNEGSEKVRIDRLVVYLEKSKFERELNISLNPGKEWSSQLYSPPFPITLKKSVGMSVKGKLEVISEGIAVEKNFTVPLSSMNAGEAVNNIAARNELSLAFLGWKESKVVVYRYKDSYYRFEAKPDMKFVVLALKLSNSGKTVFIPILDGEIATDKGIYKTWIPDFSEKYLWKGDSRALVPLTRERILPGESVVFHVVFEVPENEKPLYAGLSNVPAYLSLRGE